MTHATIDRTPRYAPDKVMIVKGRACGVLPVIRWIVHPPAENRPGCPIVSSMLALELVTEAGSRWYGFERAWIGSDLRTRVSGFSALDEVRSRWEIADDV